MIKEKIRHGEKVLAVLTGPDGKKKYIRGMDDGHNVLAVVRDKFGKVKSAVRGKNIVTNAGDTFYAQMGAGESPTYSFANCFLGDSAVAEAKDDDFSDLSLIASTEKAPSSGYPKSNDSDADNTGKAVDSVTYKYEWTTSDFNSSTINCGGIAESGASGTDPLLTRFKFSAQFEKTASDTLTLYVNHNFLGV
jgi:hypothetical protein